MNKLFISDLDGTLFNSNAEITDNTAEIINSLIERGMNFTFATARSERSAIEMTKKLKINTPCLLMNGVIVYDINAEIECRYVNYEYISYEKSIILSELYDELGIKGNMYRIINGNLTSFSTNPDADKSQYLFCEHFRDFIVNESSTLPIYFTANDDFDILLPLKENVSALDGVDCTFYEDTYTGKWFLEIFSENASKSNGIKYLKNKYNYDHVTCFGDNLNDISMFMTADVRVAVENAKAELKKYADFTALSNDEDGVAEWLKNNFSD